MPSSSSSDKARYIQAFFDNLDDRVQFLSQLYQAGRQDEAVTLCCTYVDALGNLLFWPDKRSAANFTRILQEHGANDAFSAFHLKILLRWLENTSDKRLQELAPKLEALDKTSPLLFYSEADFRTLLARELTKEECNRLDKNVWRGSLAFLAYSRVRNPFIHTLRGYGAVIFRDSTYNGRPAPAIDFHLLFEALQSITTAVRRISIESGRFFGHDLSRKLSSEDGPG